MKMAVFCLRRAKAAAVALIALGAIAVPGAIRADGVCTGISGNLVQNCNFATGEFTGWTVTPASHGSHDGVWNSGGPFSDGHAGFEAGDDQYDTISQMLATSAGESYTLIFWLDDTMGDGPYNDADFQALWDGASLLNQNTMTGLSCYDNDTVCSDYAEYTYTVTGTGSDMLTFEGFNTDSWYDLSDISVAPASSPLSQTPEPSSLVLLATGLAGVVRFAARK
jgi:hypothetical protein